MAEEDLTVAVFRKNTEGLSIGDYVNCLEEQIPDSTILHAATPQEEERYLERATVATGVEFPETLLDHVNGLELFVVASSGFNHLPVEELTREGVAVANASGIHAPGIAEQALGYCLMFARRLHWGFERHRHKEWRHYKADELYGKTVTIVGLGSIGMEFADRLEGMGVRTIGVRYTPEKGGPTDEIIGFDPEAFHDALAQTDYLVLTSPLTPTTDQLIGQAELDTLPPSAYVINVCRGRVIDTDALVLALQNEDISGAALDVTDPEPLPCDHPLWSLRNVLITPHMGGHTPAHWDRLAGIVAENVEHLRSGADGPFRNQIN